MDRGGCQKLHTRKTGRQRAPRNKAVLPLLLAVLLLFGAALFLYAAHARAFYLMVLVPRDGQAAYCLPAKRGQVFYLEYTHSVTGRQVQGSFELTPEKKIKPLTTRFDSFGPGLPYLDGSLEYTVEDGLITVFHDEEPRESIRVFVSPLTGEVLTLGGRSFDLGNLQPGPFLVEIVPASGMEALRYNFRFKLN